MIEASNTVYKDIKSNTAQFIHYPTLVTGQSDFNKVSNSSSKGNFLNTAFNSGDQTKFDYVDLRKSLVTGAARKLVFKVTAGGNAVELLVSLNPMKEYIENHSGYGLERNRYNEPLAPYNTGFVSGVHRIYVAANATVTYEIDASVSGFNIDYNGSLSAAVTNLVITAS